MKVILLALLLVVFAYGTAFPKYSQCDARWKDHRLGTSGKTICQAGCLMTSVTMMLRGFGKKVNG